ncbi:hypothetical protein MGWOODY_Hyp280 [hydrothermal vent metagenome]|uniref:Uncharacterized protein n=1 Tax=hydrothermal vent metagenome TaxID=652676 RepID=A0A160TZN6_9ZZZZ
MNALRHEVKGILRLGFVLGFHQDVLVVIVAGGVSANMRI